MIERILDALPEFQKELLKFAFEQSIAQTIEYKNGYIIGVHPKDLAAFENVHQEGVWFIGERKR
jgi:hypothetical protein